MNPDLLSPKLLAAEIHEKAVSMPDARTPDLRKLRQTYSRQLRRADASYVLAVVQELVEFYGMRFIPYELAAAHPAAFRSLTPALVQRLGAGIQGWGQVDCFARTLAGPAWRDGLLPDDLILDWAESPNLWWRRAALVSTVAWNVRSQGGMGNPVKTLMICEKLKSEREPMIAKALSWALRELAVHDRQAVKDFLERNHPILAPLVLREVAHKLQTGLKTPRHNQNRLPWEQPDWQAASTNWIKSRLENEGFELEGPIEEVQRRPWSILLRFSTSSRVLYFKACSPVLNHEPGLTRFLAVLHPECILPVVALDADRAWMILPDGGPTLRSCFQSGAGIGLWEGILPRFAELQIDLARHAQEMLDLGVIDRRLDILPGLYEKMLEDAAMLRVGKKDGLTDGQFEQVKASLPEFRRLCSELAGFDIPETLEHDDFHDGNIFYHDGKTKFFDWGESCLSHPFFSMVVGLNGIAYRFGLEADDSALDRLRDAYLEPWGNSHSRNDLVSAFNLAMQVGAVNRALTWHRVVSSLPYRWRIQNADAVPGWLQEYLERRLRYGNLTVSD